MLELSASVDACSSHLPEVVRWAGQIAKELRQYNISISGKTSGSAATDALTLADLTCQQLIVSALCDRDPIFRKCAIQAEESTGDLGRFDPASELTLAIDPIDGTKQFRDKTGDGYAVIVLLRSVKTVHYSLVFAPESGATGTWVEVTGETIRCGPDDPTVPARTAIDSLAPVSTNDRPDSKEIYLIGFQQHDAARAEDVTSAGLRGMAPDAMPGSIYELFARGDFGGSLIHSPNVYDFPVSLQIARALGGDALWVHNREPVHFRELWLDDRADMLRLPAIVACSHSHQTLDRLCDLAKDWSQMRYKE